MRTTIAIATFVALGASVAGVGALSPIPFMGGPNMRGSDTLKLITQTLITSSGVPVVYDGTGSGNGQNAVVTSGVVQFTGSGTPTQTVAPMSRALTSGNNMCTATNFSNRSEGIAFALDGLAVFASESNAGSCSADAAPGNTCALNASGVRYSGTVGGEVIDDWREVLRIVYTGMNNAAGSNIAQRDCNSAARQALVSNWQNLFQSSCAACADSNPDAAVEPGLRHAFRRDEESGTTDVFLNLLGLPTVNWAQGASAGLYERQVANSAFCNVKRQADTYPVPLTAQPHPTAATWTDPNNAGLPYVAPYFPEFQDMDPIRRDCVGTNNGPTIPNAATEQVCGPQGTLGVVLPINPPPLEAGAVTNPYPTAPCARNRFRPGDSPRNRLNVPTWCPNGDAPLGNLCWWPTTNAGSFECMNGENNVPVTPRFRANLALVPRAPFGNSTTSDGRVYNLFLMRGQETDPSPGPGLPAGAQFQYIRRPNPANPAGSTEVRITGAFYRIHTNRSLVAPFDGPNTSCTEPSATVQLGCVAGASPCSVAWAGGEALAQGFAIKGLRLNQVPPETQCIQNLETAGGNVYPFSRFLFINSYRGFENLQPAAPFNETNPATDAELNLVRAFANASPAVIEQHGYVPLVGIPFCMDFNEQRFCGAATNANACVGNPSGVPGCPATGSGPGCSYCGNGIVEPGEACDDGPGGSCPDNCGVAGVP